MYNYKNKTHIIIYQVNWQGDCFSAVRARDFAYLLVVSLMAFIIPHACTPVAAYVNNCHPS